LLPVPNVSVKDLKGDTFDFSCKKALKSQRIDEDTLSDTNGLLLENLKLLEGKFLKRAAVLIFYADPLKYVTGAYIKISYFQTDDDLLYQDEIYGNLIEQIEK
jgi:ATP-dependent DNA helicase RecG